MPRLWCVTLALAAVISLGCGAAPASTPVTIALLTQQEPSSACEGALAQGTLVPDPRSGLALVAASGERTPVMWPFGYSARLEDGQIVLLDAAGQPVATEGDLIEMGGGSGANGLFYACSGSVKRANA